MNCYVFFDVDDTLVEWRVRWQDAFVQAAAAAGVRATWELATEKLTEAMDQYYHEYVIAHCQPGPANDRDFWVDYDGRILAAMGVPGDTRPYAAIVWEMLQSPGAIALYDEVPEVLQELPSRGARLGIITGRASGQARPHPPAASATTSILCSTPSAPRSTKRETRMFELAAQAAAEAGLPAWHVGDSYAAGRGEARSATGCGRCWWIGTAPTTAWTARG